MCGLPQSVTLFKINKIGKFRYSCKDVSKKHNDLNFERYKDVLDVLQKIKIDCELGEGDIDKTRNAGFRVHDQGIVIYEQNKLGLSAYYDKHYLCIT